MSDMYQVTAECAYVTIDTPNGRAKTLLYKGALIPANTPELGHLLAGGMAAKVGGDTVPGLNADGDLGASAPESAPPAGSPVPVPPVDEVEARRADARAKLAELGGTPDGRSSEAVWVEYAVAQGLDRTEAEKVGKDELRKALAK